jgi:hypothetical protein
MGGRVVLESFVARVRLQPNFPLVLIGILFFILPYGGIIGFFSRQINRERKNSQRNVSLRASK